MFLVELIVRTCIETVYLTGTIILAGLLLGILRNSSIANLQRSFGSKAVIATGLIGVPVHELSHAILAVLFGHRITGIKLFQKPDETGVMGYVQHSFNPGSVYQQAGNFFIGIAPIFGGALAIMALMHFTIPGAYNSFIVILEKSLHVTALSKSTLERIISSYTGLIKVIFSLKNFQNPYFYVFLFAAASISSHISLSSADIKGASRGLGVIFLILLIINALGLEKYILAFNLIKYNIFITGILIVSVILSGVTFLVSLICSNVLS